MRLVDAFDKGLWFGIVLGTLAGYTLALVVF